MQSGEESKLGQRSCVFHNTFGVELQTEFNDFHNDPSGL